MSFVYHLQNIQNTVVKKYCMIIRLHTKQCKIIKKNKLQVPKILQETLYKMLQNIQRNILMAAGAWLWIVDFVI